MELVAFICGLPQLACPSCGQQLKPANYRRHLAFCAPDLLDPSGWAAGDRETVLCHAAKRYKPGSVQDRIITMRFGATAETKQQKVADLTGSSMRQCRDTIATLLHSIPPPPEEVPLMVLYEDATMIAVNKPAGVGVTPDHRWRPGSMLNRVVAHVGSRHASAVRPVHRLDKNTSGVLIFAKSADAATSLMSQFEAQRVGKSYAALCEARPHTTLVDASICRVPGVSHCQRRLCSPGESGGQVARTRLVVVAHGVGDACSAENRPCLLIARPEHGRTHQVRVHCQAAGAALLADDLYGRALVTSPSLERHALHALSVCCMHPNRGEKMEILAPLAPDMARAALDLGIVVPPLTVDCEETPWSAREAAALRGEAVMTKRSRVRAPRTTVASADLESRRRPNRERGPGRGRSRNQRGAGRNARGRSARAQGPQKQW